MLVMDYYMQKRHLIWKDAKPKHLTEVEGRIAKFAYYMPDVTIEELHSMHLDTFFERLQADRPINPKTGEKKPPLKGASLNRYVSALKILQKYALRNKASTQGLLDYQGNKEHARERHFTIEEMDRIEHMCDSNGYPSYIKAMCRIARFTGMRHSEIVTLNDPQRARVTFKKGLVTIHLLKTKNGDKRFVSIVDFHARKAVELMMDGGCELYCEKTFYRKWKEIRAVVSDKDDTEFVFHVYRHTVATNLANKLGKNIYDMGKWLGHRSPETTAKYHHQDEDAVNQTAAELVTAMS